MFEAFSVIKNEFLSSKIVIDIKLSLISKIDFLISSFIKRILLGAVLVFLHAYFFKRKKRGDFVRF